MASQQRDLVFISYSHNDRDWFDKLQTHLAPFIRSHKLTVWSDQQIPPGAKWREEIEKALARTRVAVLLVSPDFLASDFIVDNELPPLLDAAAADGVTIFWIPISASAVEQTPIWNYQAAHEPKQPLDSLSRAKRNAAFVEIVQKLERAVNAKRRQRQASPPLPPAAWPHPGLPLRPPKTAEPFVGREVELGQLAEAMGGTAPVTLIVGIAGQGKSCLLGEWNRCGAAPPAGVGLCWRRVYDVGYTFDRFLEELLVYLTGQPVDRRELPTSEALAEVACRLLAERPCWIILDGMERWLKRWAAEPDRDAEGLTEDDRAGVDPVLDDFLQHAAAWHNGSRLLLTTRALPAALESCRVETIGQDVRRRRILRGLAPDDAVELLRRFCPAAPRTELEKAARQYDHHPYAMSLLGQMLEKQYGGDFSRWRKVHPVSGKLADLLDAALACHAEHTDLLRLITCSLGPAPIAMPAELTKIEEDILRATLAGLAEWQLVELHADEVEEHSVIRTHLLDHLPPEERRKTIHTIAVWWSEQPVPDYPTAYAEIQPRLVAVEHALEAGDVEFALQLFNTKSTPQSVYTPEDWLMRFGYFTENLRLNGLLIEQLFDHVPSNNEDDLRTELAGVYNNRGITYGQMGRLEEAVADYGQALQLRRTLVESEGRQELRNELASVYDNRGVAFAVLGRLEEAVADYGQALQLYRMLVDSEGRQELRNELAGVYNNRGIAYRQMGRLEEAVADFDQALQLWQTLVDSEGRQELRNDLAMVYNNRGNAFADLGRLEEAVADYGQALQLRKRLVESEGRQELRNDLAGVYNNRGNAYRQMGRLEEAVADYDQALQLRKTLVDSEGRLEIIGDYEDTLFNRTLVYAQQGEWAAAGDDLEKGTGLLFPQVQGGQWHLWPSLLQTLGFRCEHVVELSDAGRIARWANAALRGLAELRADLWQHRRLVKAIGKFCGVLAEQREALLPAGLDAALFERVAARVAVPAGEGE